MSLSKNNWDFRALVSNRAIDLNQGVKVENSNLGEIFNN